jgi:hypothetical protein
MSPHEQYQQNRQQHINELKPLFKVVDPQQFTLAFKDSLSVILEEMDKEKYYCVRSGNKFGLSEMMVNQLMEFMYAKGKEHGISQGKTTGYSNAMKDVAEKLGFDIDN